MFSWKNNYKKNRTFSKEILPIDRYFDIAKANDNKRRIIYILLLLQLFSLTIIGLNSFKTNIKTYIIEKNGNNYVNLGYANNLSMKKYEPNKKAVEYFINEFVIKSRFLSSDLVLFKKNNNEISYFMNVKTSRKIEKYLIDSGYREKIKNKETVDINLLSTLQLTSNTYQVRWIEKTYNEIGEIIEQNLMVGVYKINFISPKSKESISYNPLGILITDVSQSVEKKER